ncbi:MAG: single-stranded-DNA-specific exonuclease RecJ [Chloroflexi bacterium]|nr:single-stranded-DNA-specific exonuclease RecJ [Chloroflexota bacterium]
MKDTRWQLRLPSPLPDTSFHPLLVRLLYNRGITDPRHFETFLAADERLAGDPFAIPGMQKAVERVCQALAKGETIAVYGDFDADGVTATVLLVQGLSRLGGTVVPYLPHRQREGYGLNQAALEALHGQGVVLVVTVDCGMTAVAEVEYARRLGLEVIITDHHRLPPVAPAAVAAVNPRAPGTPQAMAELAGVGVAYKLLQALHLHLGREMDDEEVLDLVALGTVADAAPLLGENRYLVRRGLKVVNRLRRLGLSALADAARLKGGEVDTEAISYVLGPRLNAAGRLDHALLSYNLLATQDHDEAERLARLLDGKNRERQELTGALLAQARQQVVPLLPQAPLLLVAQDNYRAGVAGIVAGKLAEEFYRPTVVIEVGPEVSRGSARSIPEFNIGSAIDGCGHLLLRFGGHAQAAGFTIPTCNISAFHQHLLELAGERLVGVDLRPRLAIDAQVELSYLDGRFIPLLESLAPFGPGNDVPTFLSRRLQVLETRALGGLGEHLRLKVRGGRVTWPAMAFHMGRYVSEVTPYLDVVYSFGRERDGGGMMHLNVKDFLPNP